MKRIFYFNVTYGCNSNCIFCYSHNTRHNSLTYNEISCDRFFDFLEQQRVSTQDRVIINGGEPFLHSKIENLLYGLIAYDCEVLIYTNGRLISKYDLTGLTKNFRFVVPIHGYEEIHDNITGVSGSYRETLESLIFLVEKTKCLVDIKLIVNPLMLAMDPSGKQVLDSLKYVVFNNAVHITKMADTKVSIRNNCKTISNCDAAYYTQLLFEYYKRKNCTIKIFDTCINELSCKKEELYVTYKESIEVHFKDMNQYRKLDLVRSPLECMKKCEYLDKCISAVDEYKVLEYSDGKLYENLE